MSYNHRQAVTAAEDHILKLGKLLEKGSFSDLIHPSHPKPEERWRDAGFAILLNESEEVESDSELRKIYTPYARELTGFMFRVTDGSMNYVLKNTEFETFFVPALEILANHMGKPRAKSPKPTDQSAPEPAWELLAMRAVVSHALSWLKKVKPKAAQPEVDGLVEERPGSFEEYLRRKAEGTPPRKKPSEKIAEHLAKSMEELAEGVKGLADAGGHEMEYIAGIPGFLTLKAWFPQLTPFDRITEAQLKKVHKALVSRKLDPTPAMNQLYGHYITHCGHLGVDSKAPSDKVKPPRKS